MANDAESSTSHTSIDIIAQELKVAIESVRNCKSPLLATSCIFRVPHLLRRHNPDAYKPDNVSIGPFHRGSRLESMESVKRWYLHDFLSGMTTSTIETLVKDITQFDKRARDCYAESFDDLGQREFAEMMILDGCFIIELFRKFMHARLLNVDDPIFSMDCMFKHICHDLLLLENQLPWFVLEHLYNLTLDKYPNDPPLRKLMLTVFSSQPPLAHNCTSYLIYLIDHNDDDEILHMLDLLRRTIVVPFKQLILSGTGSQTHKRTSVPVIPPAITLSEGGIQFEKDSDDTKSIMNVEFKNGKFTFPQLAIGELTEPLFRNLIAFEQCYHDRSNDITSYAILMDKLIGSGMDLEFLSGEKIVVNWLSAEDGCQFFNKLSNDTVVKDFLYHGLCTEVNIHHDTKWNTWLEKLKRDHFSNPWKAVSLIAAIFFLGLTVLQTAFTIRSSFVPPPK